MISSGTLSGLRIAQKTQVLTNLSIFEEVLDSIQEGLRIATDTKPRRYFVCSLPSHNPDPRAREASENLSGRRDGVKFNQKSGTDSLQRH